MRRARTIVRVGKNHPWFETCEALSKATKQLYNVGLYELRQALIHDDIWLSDTDLYDKMKSNENWVLLPRKVSNQVWKQVKTSWRCWPKALKVYKRNPESFLSRPKMPRYNKSHNIVVYEKGALGIRGLPEGSIRLSKTDIVLDVSGFNIVEVRIIPKAGHYVISAVYNKEEVKDENLKPEKIAGLDLGLNNLIAIATNQADTPHKLVNGRYLKSVNHRWNKRKASLQSQLPEGQRWSKQMGMITQKRNNIVDTHLHQVSRAVVDWLVDYQIGTVVIGKSTQWKQKICIGKKNNQNFVQIPHARLIDLITYKFEEVGGTVVLTEESYTSKASALDQDDIPTYGEIKSKPLFSGKRVGRGLYRTAQGLLVNADINGALNIIRKVSRKAFADLVADEQFIHHCASPSFLVAQ